MVAQSSNSLLINCKLIDGMYLVKLSDVMKQKNVTSISSKNIKSISGNLLDANDNKPSTLLPSDLDLQFVGSSYYTNVPSVSVRTAAELIRYFHEAWNHASKEIMCAIINNKLIDNLPPVLTSKLVNRNFPACDSYPNGNLAKRADTIAPTTCVTNEVYDKGEVWQVDNGGPITDENGKICPI